MRKTKIMTDSACDIPKTKERELGIEILSFPITIGEKGYMERQDFTNQEFYQMLLAQTELPVTSQITSLRFAEKFDEIYQQGYQDLIYVSINAKGSNTYNSAQMAKRDFYETHPEAKDKFSIHIVDSHCYSMGYGFPVMEAARKAARGISAGEIVSYLQDWFESVEIYFVPFTLEYVKRSGRVSCAAAFVGELLGLRPVISFEQGESKVVKKVRGDKATYQTLSELTKQRITPKTPYVIMRGVDAMPAEILAKALHKELGYPCEGLYEIGSAISINAGPHVVGVIFKGYGKINAED